MATSDVFVSSKTVVYEWAAGHGYGVDPQTAYEEFERIRLENDGELTADLVVKYAKPKRARLHAALYDRDDAEYAALYRRGEAQRMILQVRVTTLDNGNDTSRAYVYTKVQQEDGGKRGFYTTPAVIADNEQMYNETLERARGQLKAFRGRFEFLSELEHVFAVIDELPE